MRRRDRSQKPDPLRRVFVREGRGVVCPIDLMEVSVPFDKCCARRITPSMAFLTLSVMIRPFPARLAISAALLAPEDRQAMAADEPVLTELAARRVRKATLCSAKPAGNGGTRIYRYPPEPPRERLELPTASCCCCCSKGSAMLGA